MFGGYCVEMGVFWLHTSKNLMGWMNAFLYFIVVMQFLNKYMIKQHSLLNSAKYLQIYTVLYNIMAL